jgi:hypothetical protein
MCQYRCSLRYRNLEKVQLQRRGYEGRTTALPSRTSHLLRMDFSTVTSCRMQADGQGVCRPCWAHELINRRRGIARGKESEKSTVS